MQRALLVLGRRLAALTVFGCLSALDLGAATVTVNCNQGQKIGAALARLNPKRPNTVNVLGTCAESVMVRNFEQLTLSGTGGGAISEPSNAAPELSIYNSHDVIVRDLTIGSSSGVAIDIYNCQICKVQDSTIEGLTGVGASSVLFLKDVLRGHGNWTAFGTWDHSADSIVNCTIEPGSGGTWAGVFAEASTVSIGGTTVLGFSVGIAVASGAQVFLRDLSHIPGSDPVQTVTVENTACWGFAIEASGASTVQLDSVARVQSNAPTRCGGGGVSVTTNSTVALANGAEIVNSTDYGMFVNEGSHANIAGGARIVGSAGNGLVVVNNSTATGPPVWTGMSAEISGSAAQDIFCNASGVVSNAGQITATKVACPNLNTGPW